jgi:hypothetical protein
MFSVYCVYAQDNMRDGCHHTQLAQWTKVTTRLGSTGQVSNSILIRNRATRKLAQGAGALKQGGGW